jgi:hypothetical protein
LTLSTCSYEFRNARLVVVARMVRPGEEAYVNTSQAEINPSPVTLRYGMTNITAAKILTALMINGH